MVGFRVSLAAAFEPPVPMRPLLLFDVPWDNFDSVQVGSK
jgi:hypothetical protein